MGGAMAFLRRLLGGTAAPSRRAEDVQLQITPFVDVRDDASVQVVGEAYRRQNVALARPPGPDQLPPGMPAPPAGQYKALLMTEPTNPYDANAIMVRLWAGHTWVQVGYLAREMAAAYQPFFRHLTSRAAAGYTPAVACDAAVIPERGGAGVVLHLGTPGECAADMATTGSPTPDHPWTGKAVAFTGQSATTLYGVPVDRHAQVILARWAGCGVLPRLTKKAHALIVADDTEVTGNLTRAEEYGVPFVSEADFLAGIGIPPESIGRVSGRWVHG